MTPRASVVLCERGSLCGSVVGCDGQPSVYNTHLRSCYSYNKVCLLDGDEDIERLGGLRQERSESARERRIVLYIKRPIKHHEHS